MKTKQKARDWIKTEIGGFVHKSIEKLGFAFLFFINIAIALKKSLKMEFNKRKKSILEIKLNKKEPEQNLLRKFCKWNTNSVLISFILLITLTILISPSALAVSVSHPASAIYNGTFAGGNYYFPANLTVDSTDFHVDATTGRVGIGTAEPISGFSLDVRGPILASGESNLSLGCGNITGATSDLCTLVDTGGSGITNGTDISPNHINATSVNVTGDLTLLGSFNGSIGCGNISGAASDLCTITSGSGSGISNGTDAHFASVNLTSLNVTGDSYLDNNTIYVDSTNNRVGIGMTKPGAKLHVKGSGATLNISNATHSHLYVDSDNGYVGIGTDTPTEKLHITSPDNIKMFFERTGGANYIMTAAATQAHFGTANDYEMRIYQNNDWKMRLKNDGNIEFQDEATGSYAIFDGSANVYFNNNGNFGIGTRSPGAKLHVNGSGTILNISNASHSLLRVNETGIKFETFTTCTALETDSSGNLVCGSDADTGNPNGTDISPNHINATSVNVTGGGATEIVISGDTTGGNAARLFFENTGVDGRWGISLIDSTHPETPSDLIIQHRDGGIYIPVILIENASHNIGINDTNPQARLQVNGSLRFSDFQTCTALETDSSGNLVCGSDDEATECSTSNCDLHSDTQLNNKDICLIDGTDCPGGQSHSGWINTSSFVYTNDHTNRVGIGTRSPGANLHVNGSLNISNSSQSHLYVDTSTGYIGVGTTNATRQVTVRGGGGFLLDGDTTAAMRIDRNATTNFAVLSYQTNGIQNWRIGLENDNTNNLYYANASGHKKMTLLSESGNLGIGTSTPSHTLQVSGTFNATDSSGAMIRTDGTGNVIIKLGS